MLKIKRNILKKKYIKCIYKKKARNNKKETNNRNVQEKKIDTSN